MNEYRVLRHLLGQPGDLPKDINYADMITTAGVALPSTFNTAPSVFAVNAVQIKAGNVVGSTGIFIKTTVTKSFNIDTDSYRKNLDIYCSFFISGSPTTISAEMPLNRLALRWYRAVQDKIDINNVNENDLKYTFQEVEDHLNTAQSRVMNLLEREIIQPVLHFEQQDIAVDSNRQINLLALNRDILNVTQGILDLKITDDEDGYLNKISHEQRRSMLKD